MIAPRGGREKSGVGVSSAGPIGRYTYYILHRLRATLGRKRPLLGGVKLTHDCNLKCRHCPFWARSGESLSFQAAVSAMRTLHEWGVRITIIEGGEPFLWRDGERRLEDVVAEARKLYFSVGVTTNGTFAIETEADVVWVSIDGLKETHERIRGRCFDRVVANIEASSHPQIYAHVTINTLNREEIPELVEFLAPRVAGVTIQFHYPYDGVEDELYLPLEGRGEVLDELIDMKRRGLPVADSVACLEALKDNSWKCHSWMIASVDPSGKLTQGCYVKGRGEVSCKRCGFAAHTEMSLAYDGVLGSIRAGHRIFGGGGRK
jgi:MoaA/NifB/PqqE/SkfB family radical SAM enzyme